MTKDLRVLLGELDGILREKNPENYRKLQGPLPEEDISGRMKALGVEDKAYEDLFLWKNGVDVSEGIDVTDQLFAFGVLYSLQDIAKSVRYNADTSFELWDNALIPLIGDAAGDKLLFNNRKGKDYGKLNLYSVSLLTMDEPVSYYDSIRAMVETTIEAYQKGVFSYDSKENWLDIDTKEHRRIARKLNPGSDYWKQKEY